MEKSLVGVLNLYYRVINLYFIILIMNINIIIETKLGIFFLILIENLN